MSFPPSSTSTPPSSPSSRTRRTGAASSRYRTMAPNLKTQMMHRWQRRWWMHTLMIVMVLEAAYLHVTSESTSLRMLTSISFDPSSSETERRYVRSSIGWDAICHDFIEQYRRASRPLIHLHTQSWNMIIANEQDVRTQAQTQRDQQRDRLLERFRYLETLPNQTAATVAAATSESTSESSSQVVEDAPSGLEPLIWDEDSAIDEYFETITQRCSRSINAVEDDMFSTVCWGTIQQLVRAPRCTVRLDSRYVCDGPPDANEATQQALPTPKYTAQQVIQQHFTPDTLNIVIIGTGPVGLHLANVLNHVKENQSIRILMFEKRVEHPGRKEPYSRDWITEIGFSTFTRGDPRVVNYLDEVVMRKAATNTTAHAENQSSNNAASKDAAKKERLVNLPLMVIETLLLLSNRDLGVKFLFDDIRAHRHLLQDVPNLIVFDASGHRMDTLQRTGTKVDADNRSSLRRTLHAADSQRSINVAEWSPDFTFSTATTPYEWRYIDDTDYPVLKDLNFLPRIATETTTQGTVLYPITPDGDAFELRMLKLNDFRFARLETGIYSTWKTYMKSVMQSSHPLCTEEACGETDGFDCNTYCKLAWGWEASKHYRRDIYNRMKVEWPYFSTMCAVVSLTPDQFDVFDQIFQLGTATGKPLRELPIAAFQNKTVFKENNLIQALQYFRAHSGFSYPIASTFSSAPYIYNDVVVPLTAATDARIGNAPVLRIGDSLSSGNANLGNGLSQHLQIIEKFADNLQSFQTPHRSIQ